MLTMPRARNICLTGGAGFLGSHLVPQLLAQGARLTCLCRSDPKRMPPAVKIIKGDLDDPGSIDALLEGQDILIHMAALLFGVSWQDYLAANAAAAQSLARAVKQHGLQKTVFISSLAAAGPCGHAPGIGESARPAPVSAYGWSKLLCEETLKAELGAGLVILRPPIIYGSGDRGLLPLFKSVRRGIGISPGAFRKFPVSVIHADDCARAIVLACGSQAAGIYHLNDGQAHDMDGVCRAMARAQGKSRLLTVHAPLALMGISAAVCSTWSMAAQALARRLRLPLPAPAHWNMDKMREARQAGWLANARRIHKELGFAPEMDLDAGMAEAVQGYRALGWL